jgi:hypothetical protein
MFDLFFNKLVTNFHKLSSSSSSNLNMYNENLDR